MHGTSLFELIGIENDIKLAEREMTDWAAPRPVKKNLNSALDDVYVKPEPLGVVLIIGTWNYPWAMIFQPLVGAIAAGNGINFQNAHKRTIQSICNAFSNK